MPNNARKETQRISATATRFVNLTQAKMRDFLRQHHSDIRPRLQREDRLYEIALNLRQAWDKAKWFAVDETLEEIFQGRKEQNLRELPAGIIEPEWLIDDRPAFEIRLGSAKPVPKRRDLIDEIAFAILRASSLKLLKMCKGRTHNWPCLTPYLVADEKRRRYCYMGCGDQAKSQAKAEWHQRKKAARRRKPTGRG
jgi:hypothetical protein